MKFTQFFCPILKETPKEASIISHALMLKSGMIRQTVSGIYTFLPLGKKVLDKIQNIIKTEMDNSGAIELLMPTLQVSDIWKESGRYEDYGKEMLKIEDRHGRELVYGPTNEEQITQIFRDNVKSYKQLPLNLYHIQWKFRDEIRPRFGVMRGREFLMKDAYSFDISEEDSKIAYYKMFCAYLKIFLKLGLKAIPMKADTGPIGGDLSHEFIILAETGESEVYYDNKILNLYNNINNISYSDNLYNVFKEFTSLYASTEDMFDEEDESYKKVKNSVIKSRGIEVGHVFYFANKYSLPMKALVLNDKGKNVPVYMGAYGIGVSRLIAAIIEANFDEKGIIWPKSVAPYLVIINALSKNNEVVEACLSIYNQCLNNNIEVIYNDLDESAGSKLNTADLIGIPFQINIGNKSIQNNIAEIKIRKTNEIINSSLTNTVSEIIKLIK